MLRTTLCATHTWLSACAKSESCCATLNTCNAVSRMLHAALPQHSVLHYKCSDTEVSLLCQHFGPPVGIAIACAKLQYLRGPSDADTALAARAGPFGCQFCIAPRGCGGAKLVSSERCARSCGMDVLYCNIYCNT